MTGGYFDRVAAEVASSIQSFDNSFRVIGIHGSRLSGKLHVAQKVFKLLGDSNSVVSLPAISNDGLDEFIRMLASEDICIFTGLDDLTALAKKIVSEVILSFRLKSGAHKRIWIFTSRHPIRFADKNINLPDLRTDPETHALVCMNLLSDFPLHDTCKINHILRQSTRDLSVGDLSALVRTAKLLCISSSGKLSCEHLFAAFNSLNMPAASVSIPFLEDENHQCIFSSRSNVGQRLDDFIGLDADSRDVIDRFLDQKRTILLISGPIGCGKSHLASTVVWNPTKPALLVTSADILRSKIGETEKELYKALTENDRVIIEDIDELVPSDTSENTGSIQRCLPVLISVLDRLKLDASMSGKLIVATSREQVHPIIESKVTNLRLSNKLSVDEKRALIKTVCPWFESDSVTAFDLLYLNNRSACVEHGRKLKMEALRKSVAATDPS
jgi:hypothetical protein